MTIRLARPALVLAAAATLSTVAGGAASAAPRTPSAPAIPAAQLATQAIHNGVAAQWVQTSLSGIVLGRRVHCTSVDQPIGGTMTCTTPDPYQERLLPDGKLYLRAPRESLIQFFHFPAGPATQWANRWALSWPGTPGYAAVSDGINTATEVGGFRFSGKVVLTPPSIVDGKRVVGIRGSSGPSLPNGATATLYVTDSAHPLPVLWVAIGGGSREAVSFSGYGKHTPAPTAPPGASVIGEI